MKSDLNPNESKEKMNIISELLAKKVKEKEQIQKIRREIMNNDHLGNSCKINLIMSLGKNMTSKKINSEEKRFMYERLESVLDSNNETSQYENN